MKLRWRRTPPAPIRTPVDPQLVTRCYFHGPEPLDETTYRICGECGHAWTVDDLAAEHNKILDHLGAGPHVKAHHADTITICPHCTHDF